MSIINSSPLIAAGDDGYQIERSLRFNSPDSAYLNRTPASAGNRKTWTWSGWVKRGTLGIYYSLFAASTTGTTDATFGHIGFTASTDTLFVGAYTVNYRITSQVFRDPSAWYHIVVAMDTTQATANNRVKVYVNGTEVTAFGTTNNPTQNANLGINQAAAHVIGGTSTGGASATFDGHLAEINFINGQALTPSSFGETNTVTGVWGPKRYAGTYGTNGFYLKFADNSNTTAATLGKDSSGNGNNWTPNNFSVTAGVGNDSFIDVPTPYADGGNGRGNYCTLNPITTARTPKPSNGNLYQDAGVAGDNIFVVGTLGVSSGKWYWELTADSTYAQAGFATGLHSPTFNGSATASSSFAYAYYGLNGQKYNNGTNSTYGNTFTANDVIGVALDMDNGKLWFAKNNTWQASGDPVAGTNAAFTGLSGNLLPCVGAPDQWGVGNANFGQRAFAYTPPTGFLALNTQNLPEPSIKKPNQWMDATLYTGNGSTQSIVNAAGFQPDLVWGKSRSNAGYDHFWYDALRGTTKWLGSSSTSAEQTISGLTAFNSTGFTLGSDANSNGNASTYVGWQWKESATSGFDIVTYTGDGNTGRTVSHNLGVKPSMVIVKTRTGGIENWPVWHKSFSAESYFMRLDSTSNIISGLTNRWTAFSSTTITLGNNSETNGSGYTYVAYLWSEVAGFSKFGSYTGNGSSDGPFVHCGFRPRWVLIKRTDSANNWFVLDTSRNTYNLTNNQLLPNSSAAESTNTDCNVDVLSNGFKLRTALDASNGSGGTYIFAAFAESPQKYSLAR